MAMVQTTLGGQLHEQQKKKFEEDLKYDLIEFRKIWLGLASNIHPALNRWKAALYSIAMGKPLQIEDMTELAKFSSIVEGIDDLNMPSSKIGISSAAVHEYRKKIADEGKGIEERVAAYIAELPSVKLVNEVREFWDKHRQKSIDLKQSLALDCSLDGVVKCVAELKIFIDEMDALDSSGGGSYNPDPIKLLNTGASLMQRGDATFADAEEICEHFMKPIFKEGEKYGKFRNFASHVTEMCHQYSEFIKSMQPQVVVPRP